MTKSEKINEILGEYKLVLGLEIHLHVKTSTKMFCGCSTKGIYGAEPNSHVCPVCLGLPGALPVPNREAVEKTQLLGLALNCKINQDSRFDRKHYFYPDLPKGYQISQYKQPLCEGGFIELSNGHKIELERIHLEEDTAKSFHEGQTTLVDFNKSGIALIEMVTKPTIYFVEDAVEYAKQVQEIVRFLGVGEADMEKGQLRIEPNISLRTAEMEKANELPKYKAEVKNINSFRFMEKAIKAEILRQRKILESEEIPGQENRGYDEVTGQTILQRSKEEAHDYRYFPEPDIPPMEFSADYIKNLQSQILPLPRQERDRLQEKFGLSDQEATVLYGKKLELQLEEAISISAKMDISISPQKIVKTLINTPNLRTISAKGMIEHLQEQESSRINDPSDLEEVVQRVSDQNPQIIAQIKEGKTPAIEFLLGQVMKETKGKANAQLVREIISSNLQL
jgi:aspartyl-tRNA(Asn)/glutamyl-tRNA(Gln) amidotransferase subunit B